MSYWSLCLRGWWHKLSFKQWLLFLLLFLSFIHHWSFNQLVFKQWLLRFLLNWLNRLSNLFWRSNVLYFLLLILFLLFLTTWRLIIWFFLFMFLLCCLWSLISFFKPFSHISIHKPLVFILQFHELFHSYGVWFLRYWVEGLVPITHPVLCSFLVPPFLNHLKILLREVAHSNPFCLVIELSMNSWAWVADKDSKVKDNIVRSFLSTIKAGLIMGSLTVFVHFFINVSRRILHRF